MRTLFVARICSAPQGQRPLAQSEGDQQQHDGEEHAVLALDEHTLFGFEQCALTLDAACFRAFGQVRARGRLFALHPVAFGFVEIGHRAAGWC